MALLIDIEKQLGEFQLKIELEAGDGVLALLGASGSGKSMTLKCIAGIETPDRGRVVLDGRVLFDRARRIHLPPQKRHVGYLFQQYALFPHMTVQQNIAAGIRDKRQAAATVPGLIRAMQLEGMEKKKPRELSGGQQQRVALARILASQPETLLLDEPFSALDSHLRFQMEKEVRALIRQLGKTAVLVSHNRDEVFRMADTVAILGGGHVERLGPKAEVFANPGTRNAAILTGCRNISAARRIDDTHAAAIDWGLTLRIPPGSGEFAHIGIRMHDICLHGAENRVRFRVAEAVENPFSMTAILHPVAAQAEAELGWEVDRAAWGAAKAAEMELCLPPEKLLLLREE